MIGKSKKGYALVMLIITMAVLMIIGLSLLDVSSTETKFAEMQNKKTQAHYLGRSGVYMALNILNTKAASSSFTTVSELTTILNNYMAVQPANTFAVGTIGKFVLTYETMEPGAIKIKSEGIAYGSPQVSSFVTYIVDISPPISMYSNPDAWVNGINLRKSVSTNYLGQGIKFEGKPIQSPQNSPGTCTYQATALYFVDYRGLSLQQINNSKPIIFDAELLYFESGIELNNTVDEIKLGVSDDVLKYRALNDSIIPKYPVTVTDPANPPIIGFEDYGRYKAYIGTYTDDLFSTYSDMFDLTYKYGLVFFGGPVKIKGSSSNIINPGYYYFRNGVSLRNPNAGETAPYKNLIPIPANDAVIKAFMASFKPQASTEGVIWNEK